MWRIETADGRTAWFCGDDEAARDEMIAELFGEEGSFGEGARPVEVVPADREAS